MAINYVVHSGGADNNGGGYNPANYAGTFAELHGGTGGTVHTATGCSVIAGSGGGPNVRIQHSTTDLSNAKVGMMVYCDFDSAHADGRYEITAVGSDGGGDYIEISLTYVSDETAAVRVGGFLLLSTAWSVATDTTNPILIPSGQTIEISSGLTSTSGGRTIRGVDSDGTSWAADNTFTRPVVKATAAIDIFTLSTAAQTFILHNLDIDGDGQAAQGVVFTGNLTFQFDFQNTTIHECTAEQVIGESSATLNGIATMHMINKCDIWGGTYGIRCAASRGIPNIINSVIHDTGVGIYGNSVNADILANCVIHSCSSYGIHLPRYTIANPIINCTFANNAKDMFLDYSTNAPTAQFRNCLFYSTVAFDTDDNSGCIATTHNCAFKSGITKETGTGSLVEYGSYTLAGDPFIDSANDVYNLNPTAADFAYLYDWTNGVWIGALGPRGSNSGTSYGPEFPAVGDVKSGSGAYGWANNLTPSGANLDFPDAANVLTTDTTNGVAGTFDEAARNTDPGIANVLSGTNYKIQNSSLSGTFSESARNTDPGESNVLSGTGYKILNVSKTGTLAPDYPAVGNVYNDTTNGTPGTLTLPDPRDVLAGSGAYGVGGTSETPDYNPDFPEAANVLTTDTTNGVAGTFDEAARNTDPGIDHVEEGVTYKIHNVSLTGTMTGGGGETELVPVFTPGDDPADMMRTGLETLLEEMGEAIVYVPSTGTARAIVALVRRGGNTGGPGPLGGSRQQMTVTVLNDAAEGITAAELVLPGDKLQIAAKVGGSVVTRALVRLVTQNSWSLTLEVS